jgi:hypothetical protein
MSDNEIVRGAEAERLLNHEIIREAFDKVKEGIINAMADSPMGDERTHNRLVIALQLLDQIEKRIKEVATTGKLAKMQMNDKSILRRVGL